jgi:hypothetical protein
MKVRGGIGSGIRMCGRVGYLEEFELGIWSSALKFDLCAEDKVIWSGRLTGVHPLRHMVLDLGILCRSWTISISVIYDGAHTTQTSSQLVDLQHPSSH